MNHTTLGIMVAITMVAALAIAGVSVFSAPKALAQLPNGVNFAIDGISVGTSTEGVTFQGPNGLSLSLSPPSSSAASK